MQEMLGAADEDPYLEDCIPGPQKRRKKQKLLGSHEALEAQRAEWLLAPVETVLKGPALRCILCNGALLLNSSVPCRLISVHIPGKC